MIFISGRRAFTAAASTLRGLPLFYAAIKPLPRVGAVRGPMFRMPAYDPVAIAVLGCGVLLAAALAFPF
jgi:hypothetical protein